MFLIFDTETTGLPRNYKAPVTDTDNWPRLVQLAWQLHDEQGKLVEVKNYIVRPEGFTIPYNAEKVHGISTKLAQKKGYELTFVLEEFARAIEASKFLVGHNVEFDMAIMGAEYYRTQVPSGIDAVSTICTKLDTTGYCKIPGGKGGSYKWPQLSELHHILFNEGFDEAHNAAADVEATARCFLELVRLNVIGAQRLGRDQNFIKAFREANPEPVQAIGLNVQPYDKEEDENENETGSVPDSVKTSQKEVAKDIKSPFIHLHCHTQFSVLQGTAPIDKLIEKASALEMPAVAMTDLGNLFGAFNFVKKATEAGIKPVVGSELYMVEDRKLQKFTRGQKDIRYQQVFIAKNQNGFRNLTKLCSRGYTEGYYAGYPRIDKTIIPEHKEDLITLTGGIHGEIPDLILNRGEYEAEEAFKWWYEEFGNNFYVELIRHGLEEEHRVNQTLLDFAKKYGVKVIASNEVYYLEQEDAEAHDILLCIGAGELKSTPIGQGRGYRYGFPNNEFYFKSQQEMKELFGDIPEAIENTNEIVEEVEYIELERDVQMPEFPIPEGFESADEYLRHITFEGAKERYGQITEEVEERLNHELKIISEMGFPGYFLITADMIVAGKNMGVYVGPGRGSGAGSAVAYCNKITNLDPIKYNLLFERFLNPERVNMPDFDTDFDDEGRQKVIDYVVEKYGHEQVAHIITYGSMAAKSAIRDVGRVMELPLQEVNKLAKYVPEKIGTKLKDAFKEVDELKEILKGNDLKATVLKTAETLEGSVRNTGIHAAGIIIAPDNLTEFVPVATSKDSDLLLTQFDGGVIEDAGMLKMDFLGLKTLTILKDAIEMANRNHGVNIDLDDIPLDDKKTLELFQRGQTIGTFQFESDGMRKHLKDLKPEHIEDIIAMNALYRPGPMENIPTFIKRKHGQEKVEYPHPWLEDILQNTYGIMVYQEQIMQVAQIIGGFTLGNADILRRAMGKKKMDVMQKKKEEFVNGAKQKGIEEEKAKEIFGIMEKFASYGFNRSHAAAYSVVAFQTGYFKAHYPAEFMASVLTHHMNNIDKITVFMDEAKKINCPVLGPDVNESNIYFDVNNEGYIRFGLGAIKGTGESAVEAIINERNKNGPFKDIFDFASRINLRSVNKKSFEALAQEGAFDGFPDLHRAMFFHTPEGENGTFIEKIIRFGSTSQQEKTSMQQSLFGGDNMVETPRPKLPDCEPWDEIEKLRLEKEVVGFYISGHPLDQFKIEIENFCTCSLDEIENYKNQTIYVAGICTSSQTKKAKNGNSYGVFSIEDYNGSHTMVMFGEEYLKTSYLLNPGEFLFIKGKVEERYNQPGRWELKPQQVQLLSEVRSKMARNITLELPARDINEETINNLEELVKSYSGQCDLRLRLVDEEVNVNLFSRKYKVSPCNELFQQLEQWDDVVYKVY